MQGALPQRRWAAFVGRALVLAIAVAAAGLMALFVTTPVQAMQVNDGDADVVIELIPATSSSIPEPGAEDVDGDDVIDLDAEVVDAGVVDGDVADVEVDLTPAATVEITQAPARYAGATPSQRVEDIETAVNPEAAMLEGAAAGAAPAVVDSSGVSAVMLIGIGAALAVAVVGGFVWGRRRSMEH